MFQPGNSGQKTEPGGDSLGSFSHRLLLRKLEQNPGSEQVPEHPKRATQSHENDWQEGRKGKGQAEGQVAAARQAADNRCRAVGRPQ